MLLKNIYVSKIKQKKYLEKFWWFFLEEISLNLIFCEKFSCFGNLTAFLFSWKVFSQKVLSKFRVFSGNFYGFSVKSRIFR